ncbi:uncharacterized protein RCC_08872 [Ramularia collo-cygni]|uniref:Uncharacterized protein n=1 Tax=Ramularia collo-cygni TaxID=112498 RepID=A0A2D3VDM5_9PEZI|nr:uncharacterized protein RCC_08872 [Ramularia collo-cygni]CZT23162.1 uncharacterized protein RCC_08872 [Ramularia collo-cygni]
MNHFSDNGSDASDNSWDHGPEASTREEQLQLIAEGLLPAGRWEDSAPWRFGLDPTETPLEFRARLAREFSEQFQEIELSPAEIIAMHEAIQGRESGGDLGGLDQLNVPDHSDTDSDISMGSTGEYIHEAPFRAVQSQAPNTAPPRPRYIIGEDGAALQLVDDRATSMLEPDMPAEPGRPGVTVVNSNAIRVLLHRTRTLAAQQSEYDGEQTLRNFHDMMLFVGVPRQVLQAIYFPRQSEQEMDEQWLNNEEDYYQNLRWEAIHMMESLLIDFHLSGANFERDYLQKMWAWDAADPAVAIRFREHCANACQLTDYMPRKLAIFGWFSQFPEEVMVSLDHLLSHHCQVVALKRRIRQARIDADQDPEEIPARFAAHPHELFGEANERGFQEEIVFGFETYPDGITEPLGGSAIFTPPSYSDQNEHVTKILAGFAVYLQRSIRTPEDFETERGYLINHTSIAQWTRGADQYLANNWQAWTQPQIDAVQAALNVALVMLQSGTADAALA